MISLPLVHPLLSDPVWMLWRPVVSQRNSIMYHRSLILHFSPPRKRLCSTSCPYTFKRRKKNVEIYNGRPIELHGPPVEIYNETLAKLKHDLCDLSNAPEPSDDYISQTANLFRASAPIYDSELLWRDAVFRPLCRLLDADVQLCVKTSTEKSSRFTTEEDAAICENLEDVSYGEKAAVVAYLELKMNSDCVDKLGFQLRCPSANMSLRKM